MVSLSYLKISDFQTQLSNAIKNIHHPDPSASNLIKNFISLTNPQTNDFINLLESLKTVTYATEKSQVNFTPIINLLMSQQAYILVKDHLSISYSSPNIETNNDEHPAIMSCSGKKGNVTLSPITHIPQDIEGKHIAEKECMYFSKTQGDHYLTLTGNVEDCKGPYNSPDAYYYCISAI